MRLVPLAIPLVPADERAPFRGFVQALFGQRRKQLGTSLRALVRQGTALEHGDAGDAARVVLDAAGVDPTTRPERLTPEEFVTLFRAARAGGALRGGALARPVGEGEG